jgi:Holliday junction DNA helicase RuvA
MISRICGTITERGQHYVLIDVGGLTYEVWLPVTVEQRLDEAAAPDGRLRLITYHYLQVDPSRSIPVLIGFINEVEKEFFESFITVSGIGPRAALKALNQPISAIARAIDEADLVFLKSLPGIGQQRAKEIVAKLQHKVGKFGLIKDSCPVSEPAAGAGNIEEEALAVLAQLGYKKAEALSMIQKAIKHCPGTIGTTEGLLNEVYKHRKTD